MVLLKLLKDLIDGNDGIGDRDAVLKRCLDEVKGLSGLITGDNPPVFQGGILEGERLDCARRISRSGSPDNSACPTPAKGLKTCAITQALYA